MNINWKFKSIILYLICKFNFNKVLFFIQKYITKNSNLTINAINQKWLLHKNHLEKFQVYSIIELGAGKSLAQNIYLSNYFPKQELIDINAMIDFNLVNKSFLSISRLIPSMKYSEIKNLDDLDKVLNIKYNAPFNIISNHIHDNSYDACISTDTLEHISYEELYLILIKLKKIIKNNGFLSLVIDYSDHYSHTDKNITKLNFLKFDSKYFQRYNHKNHFQNRLRHYEYENLFKCLNFSILTNKITEESNLPEFVSNEFDVKEKTLNATQGYFLLQVNK